MKVLALGVGNAFSALWYSSCLAVQAEGAWLLLDCPHPVRKMVREASLASGVTVGLEDCRLLALTHLHADHCSGVEDWLYFHKYAVGAKPTVAAHPAVAEGLWRGHLAGGMEWSVQAAGEAPRRRGPEDFYDLVPLDEQREVRVGPFALRCRRTVHSVPTTALLVRAGGRCLGYSADTAFDRGLIDWLAEADLVVHETGEAGLHTPYRELAGLPEGLRKRMRLIHYDDAFDAGASDIAVLRQGACYDV